MSHLITTGELKKMLNESGLNEESARHHTVESIPGETLEKY